MQFIYVSKCIILWYHDESETDNSSIEKYDIVAIAGKFGEELNLAVGGLTSQLPN
jgi:hypothetical protein